MKATKENIGQTLYPIDNSYCTFLDDGSQTYPAGIHGVMASPVKVLTEPFTNTIGSYGEPQEHEFVLVEYQGRNVRVLNGFFDDLEAAEKATDNEIQEGPYFYWY